MGVSGLGPSPVTQRGPRSIWVCADKSSLRVCVCVYTEMADENCHVICSTSTFSASEAREGTHQKNEGGPLIDATREAVKLQ